MSAEPLEEGASEDHHSAVTQYPTIRIALAKKADRTACDIQYICNRDVNFSQGQHD